MNSIIFNKVGDRLTKIIILTFLLFAILSIIPFMVFNLVYTKDKIAETNVEELHKLALQYSKVVNGDSIELDFKRGEKNRRYASWDSIADYMLAESSAKYLYVMDIDYDDSITYYISAKDEEGKINFLEKESANEFDVDMIERIKENEEDVYFFASFTPKYGFMTSSYVPVKNLKDEVVAFVGADKEVTSTDATMEQVYIVFVLTSFLFSLIIFLCSVFIIRKLFIKPIKQIAEAANNFNMLDVSFEHLKYTKIKEYDALIKSFKTMEKRIRIAVERSSIDDLTRLNNRYYFTIYLENMLKLQKKEVEFVFFLIDLDNFKNVNDTYGHNKGDFVLKKIGEILHDLFKDVPGAVSRLGGDEFAICIQSVNKEFAKQKCAAIKDAFIKIKCSPNCNGVKASIGVVVGKAGREEHAYSEIFNTADTALYKVKSLGKDGSEIVEI